jgi:hypothetical protein
MFRKNLFGPIFKGQSVQEETAESNYQRTLHYKPRRAKISQGGGGLKSRIN